MIKKFFKYIEPLWSGPDGKISLRSTLAIIFSYGFIKQLSYAIYKWSDGRSMEGLSLVLGIEAGLIVALLGLTTYQNMATQKIDALAANPQPAPITIQKAETVTVPTTTTNTTAETVNAKNVETLNSNTTNVSSKSPAKPADPEEPLDL